MAALLRGLVLALATLVLAVAAGLLALERSGWLEGRVRTLLASQLGEPVEVEAVRLRWLAAALEIEGLSLGQADARLERVRIVLRGGRGTLVRVAQVEVVGGRVVLGEALRQRLAGRTDPSQQPAALRLDGAASPAVSVRDVQVDLFLDAWGLVPLGQLQATYALDGQGRRRLAGRLLPGAGEQEAGPDEDAAIHWSGVEDASGELELTIACVGLPVATERVAAGARLESLGLRALHGWLDLEGTARLAVAQARLTGGELRARFSGGELSLQGSDTAVRDATLALEARCAPGPDESVLDAGAWRAALRLQAEWRGAEAEAWAVWGSHAGRGLRGRGWARVRDLPLDEESFERLGLRPTLDLTLDALEPRGLCTVGLAGELPVEGPPRGALEVVCDGLAGMSYRGWPSLVSGRPAGFPMPVEALRGRLFGVVDPARPSALQVVIVRAQGSHAQDLPQERLAWASGQIRRPVGAPPHTPAELVLRLAGRRIAVDGGGIPVGLAGLEGTDWVWPAFAPTGGEVAFEALLSKRADDLHLGAQVDIDLDGVGLAWEQLPLSVTGLRGRLSLRFDPRRGWGAGFRLEGRTPTSDRLGIAGRLQREPALPRDAQPLEGVLEELAIEAENVALRGTDRQVLEATAPALGTALEQVAPAGKVDVRLRRSRARGEREGRFVIEVTPREVQFAPQAFRVPTRDVRGRVLVAGARLLGGNGASAADQRVRVALAPLVGVWPGEVLVGCTAVIAPGTERSSMQVFASGVPPLQGSVIGALQSAFAAPDEGYGGLELAALSVDGRVDVDGRIELGATADRSPAAGRMRVHLRDNAFRVAPPSGRGEDTGFGLDRLRGTLVQRGDVLSGSDIRARLGRTAVVLSDARFELLSNGGYRLEARPAARGLPLDREHLRFFLDPATVDALVDELGFTGRLDIDDALLVLAGSGDGAGSVQLEGRVRPRALQVDLGLPLSVDAAAVRVKRLVFERGQVRAWASVDELYGNLAGRRLEDTRLQLTYLEPRLSVFDLEGTLEGGRLADLGEGASSAGPVFSIDLQAPFRFDLGLRLENVRVENLLRGLFESEFASRGALSGELRLEGSLDAVRQIRGDGSLLLRDTTLWSIPVMQALFSQLGFDGTAVFERMRTRFEVREGAFHMSEMQVYSPLLQLVGAGTLDMEGRLNHDLEVRYSLVDRLGPFTRLVYWVQNNLLRLAVRGDMSRPRIELQGILSVFQSRPPTGRDLPLPALAPLPARF